MNWNMQPDTQVNAETLPFQATPLQMHVCQLEK